MKRVVIKKQKSKEKEGGDCLVSIYLRVSTREQTIEMQQDTINRYCTLNEISSTKIYKDIGVSGGKESRPGFNKLLDDMRNGKIKTVIVYKLDRIGRSLIHLLKLFEEFKNRKINFISVTQNINTSAPEGKMFLRMLMVLAEYERELIVNRINDGLTRAKASGIKLGRPKGAKDKKRRRTSGYNQRWINEKAKKLE